MEIVIDKPQIQDPKRHVKTRPKIKKPNLLFASSFSKYCSSNS